MSSTDNSSSSSKAPGKFAYFKLFSFADPLDYAPMAIGVIASLGIGLCLPLMTLLFGQLANSFGHNHDTPTLVNHVSQVSLKFVYLVLGSGVAAFSQVSCWMITGERQGVRIRNLYLKAVLRQDIGYFDKETNTGEIVERISTHTAIIQDAIGEKVGKFLQLTSSFIGGFGIAFSKGWLLTLVLLSAIPVLVLSAAVMTVLMVKLTTRGHAAYSEAAVVVDQTISSIRNYALAVWFGAKMIINKGYSGGAVLNITMAVLLGSFSLGQISPCMSAFGAGREAAVKVLETIERKPEIDPYNTNGKVMKELNGDVELRDVYFSYPTRPDEPILNALFLRVHSGTSLALVGESGSGKSTIISLVERFYDPQGGQVLIDGINIKEYRVGWIRSRIGLVSQEPVLFASTIRENIAYGKAGASLEEIRAAAQYAHAAKFIDKLPQGLDTLVGVNGSQLSGGEKQRVALARAILKDPKILLLDEATSALDAESEKAVQEALDRVMMYRTTLIVAHRLSTVVNADSIDVIRQGKISEKGSHSELIRNPQGEYTRLIHLQDFNTNQKLYEEATQVASDAVGNIRTVASFCAEEKVMELHHKKCEGPVKLTTRHGLLSGAGFGMSFFLLYSVYATSYYAGARLVDARKISFAEVFRVFLGLSMTAVGISQSGALAPDSGKAKASAASIFEVVDHKSKIDSADNSGMTLEIVKGDIRFQHVSFRYPNRPDVEIFKDLCLDVHSGKMVAIVGESGCGKSTIISLLQRFYDPDSGEITIDGFEINKLKLKWLRQQIGLVSQEPVLFNDTIRANIEYGKEDNNASEVEILAAAKLANANNFITALHKGYETIVGESGIQLSGGQKQRVAIARALVKDPKILLLDEATSALDTESEKVIQDALERAMVERSTIVVAHMLSTVKNADLIVVLKNGVIAEKGKHETLISKKHGIYASLLSLPNVSYS